MRKEIAPELYNYNKFPGPEFHVNGDKVETEQGRCMSGLRPILQLRFR